ncbi:hypothetical protein ACP26L_22870 [Paenibacillus sp. S-38]|uniref:zinc dependent phospholipase C family protein n=1 Tax=Paenibacillus sp. S-38 TaxID=3416710 RepID=UPI003CF261E8
MPSRIMHLIIADALAKEIGAEAPGSLLLGALAPDAAKADAAVSETLHFASRSYIAYGEFLHRYAGGMPDPFLIGYLSHLVGDDIWSIFVHAGGIRARVAADPRLAKVYYRDFLLCNAKLLESYPKEELYAALHGAEIPSDWAGGHIGLVPLLAEQKRKALLDFEYPSAHLTEELQLLSMNDIRQGMDRCIQRTLDLCRPWLRSAAEAREELVTLPHPL